MKQNINKTKSNILILVIAGSAFLFEQSPANEALRVIAGLWVLSETGNALLVGLSIALITMVVESTTSTLISLGLHNNARFKKFIEKRRLKNIKLHKKSSIIADATLAIGVGSGIVVIKRHLKCTKPTLSQDLKTAFGASLGVAIFSGFIGFLAGGGIEIARKYGFGGPMEQFLKLATDWRFWVVVICIAQLSEFIRNRSANKAHHKK